jgi:glycogen(starch) synthase
LAVRILFLTPLYVPNVGGLETLVSQLAPALRARGHDIAIVSSHGREATAGCERVDDIPVVRVDAHDVVERRDASAILRVQLEIARFAREFDPDLVHSHDAGPVLWMYSRAARRDRRPLVVTLHNVMTRKFTSVLAVLAKLLRQADWVTCVSHAVAADVLRYEPSVASRMSVITNGIAPPFADVSPIEEGPPRLLCIGRLDHQKGFDVAIAAFARIQAAFPEAQAVVAGDGPQRGQLMALAEDFGCDGRVEFVGDVGRDQVAALLRECTMVVMPSRYEGLPLVALEAAWAGRPVVGTESPGLTEAVLPGETALLVPPDDPDALGRAIAKLSTDRSRANELGRKARAHAEQSFTLRRCADDYDELYHRVVDMPL